ncbi:MAG: tyrosine--tRNA ligase, partial [Methanobacteriota archaeon]
PETAILIHDPPEEIARKVERAFCPPKDTEDNFVTEVARLILLPKGPLKVERPAKFGGDVTYDDFEGLAKAYRSGELHPKDLKAAVSQALADRLAPVREYFRARPENLDALRKILAA